MGIIRRQTPPLGGLWHIPDKPILLAGDKAVEWTTARTDTDVKVPLFPYLSMDFELATLIGSGLVMGVVAGHYLPRKCRLEALHVFMGSVWRDSTAPDGYQYWLGFAFRCVGLS